LGFVFLIILLWLLGTNYQNNLVLGTAFLLLALMVVCIHHTFGNLSGLQVSVLKTQPGFVGDVGRVELLIKKQGRRDYEAIDFFWDEDNRAQISLIDEAQITISLPLVLGYRGWFQPERLHVVTRFPLGLIVGWSYLDLDAPILAYPQPISVAVQALEQVLDDTDDLVHQPLIAGHEEFAGLREYYPGDSLRAIDWRALARGQGLAVRQYEDYASQHHWFDWQQFEGMSREARLSRLCACVLQQGQQGGDYGLRLPGLIIEPGQGEQHQQRVLQALALFEWQQNTEGDR
jgi:uncharacterized protein (DUF58 family)